MAQPATLVVNGRKVATTLGTTLLDAALGGRVVIPHDCATGQCNTCRVRVFEGAVDDAGTASGGTVLACRARVTGDVVVEFDEVPDPVSLAGTVVSLEDLTRDIVQVVIGLEKTLTYLPGQYVKATFKGFASRDYSPSLRCDGSADLNELVLHIRREPGGAISGALGRAIKPGHPVRVKGPHGSAYHRLGPGRLILVSTGVGFAPIWAIARASRIREPDRPMVVVAGARHHENLYMREPLEWLRERGVAVTLACSGIERDAADVVKGRPTLHLPRMVEGDTVMACGAPGMVAAVELLAAAGGATCYADPFLPARTPMRLRDRLLRPFLMRHAPDPAAAA